MARVRTQTREPLDERTRLAQDRSRLERMLLAAREQHEQTGELRDRYLVEYLEERLRAVAGRIEQLEGRPQQLTLW